LIDLNGEIEEKGIKKKGADYDWEDE